MQRSTNHLIGLNFWRVTQVSTDRWIGPNFKGGWRDLRTAESVRILKEVCRNPRTAESGRILKEGYTDLRTTESVRIFETKCRNPRTFESVWIFEGGRLKGDDRIRGLLNHSEFLMGDAEIYEPPISLVEYESYYLIYLRLVLPHATSTLNTATMT